MHSTGGLKNKEASLAVKLLRIDISFEFRILKPIVILPLDHVCRS